MVDIIAQVLRAAGVAVRRVVLRACVDVHEIAGNRQPDDNERNYGKAQTAFRFTLAIGEEEIAMPPGRPAARAEKMQVASVH